MIGPPASQWRHCQGRADHPLLCDRVPIVIDMSCDDQNHHQKNAKQYRKYWWDIWKIRKIDQNNFLYIYWTLIGNFWTGWLGIFVCGPFRPRLFWSIGAGVSSLPIAEFWRSCPLCATVPPCTVPRCHWYANHHNHPPPHLHRHTHCYHLTSLSRTADVGAKKILSRCHLEKLHRTICQCHWGVPGFRLVFWLLYL